MRKNWPQRKTKSVCVFAYICICMPPPNMSDVCWCPVEHEFVLRSLTVQVTCVERGTSKGTVKKQIRDTLKQLRKDEEAVHSLLQDLPLPHLSVVRVLALPNLSQQELRQKLETRMLKVSCKLPLL